MIFFNKYTKNSINFFHSYSFNALFFIAGLFVVGLLLVPYTSNGFWYDDALNSQIYYLIDRVNGDLFDFSYRVVKHWLYHEGRFMFAFYYGYSGFYFFNDLFDLRVANSILIIINILLFGYVFCLLGASIPFLVIWSIILVGLFQISGAGLDPVAGFAFHYPILGIQLSIVFILFIKWILYKKNLKYLYFSLVLWLFFLLSYEINFIFFPIALILILLNDEHHKKLSSFLLIFASCLYLALYFYFKNYSNGGGYQGSSFGNLSNFSLAYLKQLTASFPFISYLAVTHKSIPFTSLIIEIFGSLLALSVFILSLMIILVFTKVKSPVSNFRKEAFVISLGMFLLPAIFPAISLRYQNEVSWGAGTLPVYYQNFGFAFFAACAMSFVPKIGVSRFIIPISLSVYLAFNVTINSGMVKIIDKVWREPRDTFAIQAQSGLFSEVQDGDIIRVRNVSNYINANLIFQWSGKRVYIPTDDHFWYPESPRDFANTFELSRSEADLSYLLLPEDDNASLAK
jgi:hypothetical protein